MAAAAIAAYRPRRQRSIVRRLTRSATTPSPGASRVPPYWSAATTASRNGEPVWTSTYQPRIRFSISKPEEVVMSDPHWKRKLRMEKGARSPRPALVPAPRDPDRTAGAGSPSDFGIRGFNIGRRPRSWRRAGFGSAHATDGERPGRGRPG